VDSAETAAAYWGAVLGSRGGRRPATRRWDVDQDRIVVGLVEGPVVVRKLVLVAIVACSCS